MLTPPTVTTDPLVVTTDSLKLDEQLNQLSGFKEQEKLIGSWFENLETEQDRQLNNFASLITELESRAKYQEEEAKRLKESAEENKKRAEILKRNLKCFLEKHKFKELKTSKYQLVLSKNGGKRPVILVSDVDPTKLPKQYQRVSVAANLSAIRNDLEAGKQLTFAYLGERGYRLHIQTLTEST